MSKFYRHINGDSSGSTYYINRDDVRYIREGSERKNEVEIVFKDDTRLLLHCTEGDAINIDTWLLDPDFEYDHLR